MGAVYATSGRDSGQERWLAVTGYTQIILRH
jgi:hypothetical protein